MTYPPNPWGDPSPQPFGQQPFGQQPFGQQPWPAQYSQQAWPGSPPPPTAPPGKSRKRAWIWGAVAAAVVVAVVVAGVAVAVFSGDSGTVDRSVTIGTPRAHADQPSPPADDLLASLEQPPSAPRWTYSTGGIASILGGDAQTVMVDVGARAGIMALDAATGAPRWSRPTPVPGAGYNCAISADTKTIGCHLHSEGSQEFLIFLDAATGAVKHRVDAERNSADLHFAGGVFVHLSGRTTTAYRPDGTVAWQTDSTNGGNGAAEVRVYDDQGIVIIGENGSRPHVMVLDASTGKPIVEAHWIDKSVVFSTGFALAYRDGLAPNSLQSVHWIDFYDFSGRKTASLHGEDYRLLTAEPDEFNLHRIGPTGFDYPLVYKLSGELAAVNPASGEIVWSQSSPVVSADLVYGLGIGTVCVVGGLNLGAEHDRITLRPCRTQSPNSFTETTDIRGFVGTDGERMLLHSDNELLCIDGTSGQEIWRMPVGYDVSAVGGGLYEVTSDGVNRRA